VFNERINGENLDLIFNISYHSGVVLQEAKSELKYFVDKVKRDLEIKNEFELGDFGKFVVDANSLIKFELYNRFVYNYNTLGFSDISLLEISKPSDFKKSIFKPKFRISMSTSNEDFEQVPDSQFEDNSGVESNNEEIEDISEEEEAIPKSKVSGFAIFSGLIILFLSASAIYLFTTNDGKESLASFMPMFKKVSEADSNSIDEKSNKLLPEEETTTSENSSTETSAVESSTEAKTETKFEEKIPVVLSELVSEKTGKFYIIGGGFGSTSNAKILSDKAKNSGLNSSIIAPFGDSNVYRVSLADFATQEEALKKAAELRSEFGNEIWVLNY